MLLEDNSDDKISQPASKKRKSDNPVKYTGNSSGKGCSNGKLRLHTFFEMMTSVDL